MTAPKWTPEDSAAAEALLDAVSMGDWHFSPKDETIVSNYDGKTGGWVSECVNAADAAFIAAAPELLRKLLHAVAEMQRERDEAVDALRELYDASLPAAQGIPFATEDWHHDFFTARGAAHRALSKRAAQQPGGDDAH